MRKHALQLVSCTLAKVDGTAVCIVRCLERAHTGVQRHGEVTVPGIGRHDLGRRRPARHPGDDEEKVASVVLLPAEAAWVLHALPVCGHAKVLCAPQCGSHTARSLAPLAHEFDMLVPREVDGVGHAGMADAHVVEVRDANAGLLRLLKQPLTPSARLLNVSARDNVVEATRPLQASVNSCTAFCMQGPWGLSDLVVGLVLLLPSRRFGLVLLLLLSRTFDLCDDLAMLQARADVLLREKSSKKGKRHT